MDDRDRMAAVDDATSLLAVTSDEYAPDVVTVELDRPDRRNALNVALRQELCDVCDALATADGLKGVVLTGSAAAGAFAAGGDVRDMRDRDALEQRAALEDVPIYRRIAELPVPVVARITGYALGGGCELAMASDIRIAHREATLGLPEINLGIFPGGGGTQRLPRLVGAGRASRLILTGEHIDAPEAVDIGLVDEMCDDDDALDERVTDIATALSTKSALALRTAKRAIRASYQTPLDTGLEYERELFTTLFASGEKDEGIDAFLAGRDPEWRY
ncbi:enoyl-CoA hydratase/isomerase family protein [Halomarina ordinaria]|uniref:Enoyl-CoA hydratase/isomerase family protein n=1 Tax=Halomarina ordinaria TaxID=3033939 RepID=A0ABD5UHH6_9EURY|nr:enoyl-CoA hydratase-related protein [Halomarina sp. PSRA2]